MDQTASFIKASTSQGRPRDSDFTCRTTNGWQAVQGAGAGTKLSEADAGGWPGRKAPDGLILEASPHDWIHVMELQRAAQPGVVCRRRWLPVRLDAMRAASRMLAERFRTC